MKRRTTIWALTGLLALPAVGQGYEPEPTLQNDQWRQGMDGLQSIYRRTTGDENGICGSQGMTKDASGIMGKEKQGATIHAEPSR